MWPLLCLVLLFGCGLLGWLLWHEKQAKTLLTVELQEKEKILQEKMKSLSQLQLRDAQQNMQLDLLQKSADEKIVLLQSARREMEELGVRFGPRAGS